MFLTGFCVAVFLFGWLYSRYEQAKLERERSSEEYWQRIQRNADQEELFQLEMGAKGCAWQKPGETEWRFHFEAADARRLEALRAKLKAK